MWGCDDGEKLLLKTESGITVTEGKNSMPEFRRIYTAKLDNRAEIKVEMKSYSFGRSDWSTLTQPNGNYVLFDMDKIAEKIIDPTLVPKVEVACKEIRKLDNEYMATGPQEYRDDKGVTWHRVGQP